MKKIILVPLLFITTICLSATSGELVWKYSTNGRIYSSPLILENSIFFGSGDSTFYSLQKQTGELQWQFKADGAIHSDPCARGNTVYFSTSKGSLYALSIIDGSLQWKFESEGDRMVDMWDYYISSPKLHNGIVYWGSGDGFLYAVGAETGNLVWKHKANGTIHANPLIANNTLFFGDFGGNFYALNAESGKLIWQFRTVGDTYFPNGEIQKGATFDNGTLYFGSRDFNIYALNAQTGRGKWNMKELGSWIIATPLIFNDYIYFGTSDTHRFYCLNKISGEIIWHIPLPMRVYGSAIEHDEVIYFGCFDGILRGANYKTGEIVWQFQTIGNQENYSKIYDERGNFRSEFELYGKDYIESERLIHTLGSILSTPSIDNNLIYFGSSDGSLYSIKIE